MGDAETKAPEKVNFEPILAAEIPKLILLSKTNLSEAITKLLLLEKRTRLASSYEATTEVALTIVKICFDLQDWAALNANIQLLSKRRAQHRNVITGIVKEACKYLVDTPDVETKVELINSLRAVTAGKIYVELEHARLTKTLAEIKEAAGNMEEAASILQEVTVETCGSMEKMEKTEYILEQLRLLLSRSDLVRSRMVARKIDPRLLEGEDMQALKLRFYNLMLELHGNEQDALALARDHYAIARTPSVTGNDKLAALAQVCVFLVLAPRGPEQLDLLRAVRADNAKDLESLPAYKALLTLFLTREIIPWPLPVVDELQHHPAFTNASPAPPPAPDDTLLSVAAAAAGGVGESQGQRWWAVLRNRVVAHNISVVSECYSRITTPRLGALLGLAPSDVERHLSAMVWSSGLGAKIDRPKGVVTFRPKTTPSERLTAWAGEVSSLLQLVENTCHLINKENMIHKLA